MKVESVCEYIEGLNRHGELDWLKSKLLSNRDIHGLEDRVESFDDVYVGIRDTDLGWVFGYRTTSGGILDVGMLADWYCRVIRDVRLQDIKHIRDLGNGDTFDPLNKKSAELNMQRV